jgi:hypothetical protein
LAPVGIGTSDVESLSGYIARLAQAHVVSVADLVGQELMGRHCRSVSDERPPSIEIVQHSGCGFHTIAYDINGFLWRARKWTRKIGSQTGRADIEQVTLIPFARVLSAMLLFKHHRTWCPFCYAEDRGAESFTNGWCGQ